MFKSLAGNTVSRSASQRLGTQGSNLQLQRVDANLMDQVLRGDDHGDDMLKSAVARPFA